MDRVFAQHQWLRNVIVKVLAETEEMIVIEKQIHSRRSELQPQIMGYCTTVTVVAKQRKVFIF